MELINHHVHSTGSDGELTPEQVIELAIENNLTFICFTDHYPYPPGFREWGIIFHSQDYYENIGKLKQKYKNKIEISFRADLTGR